MCEKCQPCIDADQLFGVLLVVSEVPHTGLIGIYNAGQGGEWGMQHP